MGKESEYSVEQLEELQEEWIANFEGVHGQWRIPLLNGDVKVLDLLKSNRDMEYQKFMDTVASIICAVYGISPEELGLRFTTGGSIMTDNADPKQKSSRSRGLNDLLGDIAGTINKLMRLCGWADKYVFEFTGIEPADKAENSKLRKEAVETYKTVNEARAEEDLEPIEGGDILLNSVFIQNKMSQAGQPGGDVEEKKGYEDDDSDWNFDDDIEEIVDEQINGDEQMTKARTLLI